MTITYTHKVSDCKGFGSFWRLLFRWKGSLYKLVWPDTLVYCFLYFICSMVYRFALDDEQRRIFEHLSLYCDYFRNLIPISFVLGFYVSVVVQRWWEQYLSIPWPDNFALFCSTYISGQNGPPRLIRSTMLRYVNLNCALIFAKISPIVKKKFPAYKNLKEAGYMTANEMRILEAQGSKSRVPVVFLPLMWACKLVDRARTAGYIKDDFGVKLLLEELGSLRNKSGMLLRWTEISIPLVYTQVVTMAVYSFFFFSVLGRQFLDPAQNYSNRTIDFFVPVFTLLQFFFYMGWLKVAESLVNPFGEDDDDFEMDKILDRHLEMSYLLGNITTLEDPTGQEDMCWDKTFSQHLDDGDLGMFSTPVRPPNPSFAKKERLIKQTSLDSQPEVPNQQQNLLSRQHLTLDIQTESPKCGTSSRQRGRRPSKQGQPTIKEDLLSDEGEDAASEGLAQTPTSQNRNPFDFMWEEMDISPTSDILSPSRPVKQCSSLPPGFDNRPNMRIPGTAPGPKDSTKGHVNPGFSAEDSHKLLDPTSTSVPAARFGNHVEGIANPRYSPEVPSYPSETPANDALPQSETQRLHTPDGSHIGALRKVPSSPSSLSQRQ
ncbi:bestrophin-2-like isoform X2 [Penaeus japonicus]|uniref:bestrophin-2-like isoform X2 n=1 Tax=Penaeus japonicus TaxID=27405 RepID=UPI001C714A47|nr:bestrophin-2-like isoform X2 [Penaeus japonicus]